MNDLAERSRVLTLVFTDLVDSTALKAEKGDRVVGELILRHRNHVTRLAEECAGRIIDWAGDGCFLTFETPSTAVVFALHLQRAHSAESDLPKVRIGVHMGEITERAGPDGDPAHPRVEGLSVDLAARIESLASPGQILLSSAVFNSARQRLDADAFDKPITWLAHGPFVFKGFDERLEICEVGFEGISPLHPPKGSDKSQRAVVPGDEDTLGWRPAARLTIPGRENWSLEEQIGEGGFGEVWVAKHRKTLEKRIFKFCFQPERVRGLKREVVLFRLLKQSLGHREDIAQILDWSFDTPPYFLEAEYTEGGDLKAWARKRNGLANVPLETRLDIVAQAAAALGAAHSVGILHKDFKPGNILVQDVKGAEVPRASLTDFGIGLLTDPGALKSGDITATGLTESLFSSGESSDSGTRMYMAPELIEGKPGTTLSDIYALGVVLYQMIAGDFSRAMAPGWERGIDDELLREDIAACVDGSPEHRIPSAAELADRLRTLEKRRKERAEAREQKRIAEKSRIRRRQFTFVSSVGVIITVIVAVFAFRQAQLRTVAEVASRNARTAEQKATEARIETEEALDLAQRNLYLSNIRYAASEIDRNRFAEARTALLHTPPHLRGFEWGLLVKMAWSDSRLKQSYVLPKRPEGASTLEYWERRAALRERMFSGHLSTVNAVAFSPDSKVVFTASGDGTVRAWDVTTGEPTAQLESDGGPVVSLAVSHDGNVVATFDYGGIHLWDAASGSMIRTFQEDRRTLMRGGAFIDDDRRLATISVTEKAVFLWDVASGRLVKRIEDLGGTPRKIVSAGSESDAFIVVDANQVAVLDREKLEITNAYFAPSADGAPVHTNVTTDGLRALTIYRGGDAVLWRLEGGPLSSFENFLPQTDDIIHSSALSDDGTVFAIALGPANWVRVFDVLTGEEIRRTTPKRQPMTVALNLEGTILASACADRLLYLWDPIPETDAIAPDRLTHSDIVYQSSISPDGKRALTGSFDKTARLWNLETGELLRTFQENAELIYVEFSPDARVVSTHCFDGTGGIWDVETGERIYDKAPVEATIRNYETVGGLRGVAAQSIAGLAPPSFSHDGRRALVRLERTFGVLDLDRREIVLRLDTVLDDASYAMYGPDDALVCVWEPQQSRGAVFDAATGSLVSRLTGHVGLMTSCRFHPDGTRVLTAGFDNLARVFDARSGEELLVLRGHSGPVMFGAYTSNGDRIITTSFDSTAKLWDAESGEELTTLEAHGAPVVHAAFSPDDSRLVTYSLGEVVLWTKSGERLMTIGSALGGDAVIRHVAWSPDGSSLLVSYATGEARLYSSLQERPSEDVTEESFGDWLASVQN